MNDHISLDWVLDTDFLGLKVGCSYFRFAHIVSILSCCPDVISNSNFTLKSVLIWVINYNVTLINW